MKTKTSILSILFITVVLTLPAFGQYRDFGDAPEGALAYPSLGVIGAFPTCMNVLIASWIQHTNFGAWFGPLVDFEPEGNGGLCPSFPPYDNDECFADGDAGLIIPPSYTIVGGIEVPCPNAQAGSLGNTCQPAPWGQNVDILVHNTMPGHVPYLPAFVNVLMDWNQNGAWGGSSSCPPQGTAAPEHVLVDFIVPPLFIGPLSALQPPPFLIGPNPGYVWTRFTITEIPLGASWTGEGGFEDGESEDYLLRIDQEIEPTMFPVLTECPVVETKCPASETHCPVIETQCPTGETWCPAIPTKCPQVQTHCPVVDTECPVVNTQCPAQGPTICPDTATQCPVVQTLCPIQPTLCPNVYTWCPEVPTMCPIMQPTTCPSNPTFCPGPITFCSIQTFCPEDPTRCFIGPPPLTLCPVIPTVCPITPVMTECPEIATECPVIPTVCQTIDPTVCPVDPTYCPLVDTDGDGVDDCNDNCPNHPNGPLRGTCTANYGSNRIVSTGQFCYVDGDCDTGEFCEKAQADTYPPGGNGIGDACECEGNFDCDEDIDSTDVTTFLEDSGRNQYNNPCTNSIPCDGDFLCDRDVDSEDVTKFLEDVGRNHYNKPCPFCTAGTPWCVYP